MTDIKIFSANMIEWKFQVHGRATHEYIKQSDNVGNKPDTPKGRHTISYAVEYINKSV